LEKFDFVVLGAGVAGLAFAKRMSEQGRSVLVLEKESVPGGLSRTLDVDGFRLDFCAHRFHSANQALLREVLALPGLKMAKLRKKSRIYMFGRWLKYPFELQNLLRAMPLARSLRCGLGLVRTLVRSRLRKGAAPPKSYRDWFVSQYGESLYEVMCEPYTSKIWRCDPALLSADWADQRFQGENLKRLAMRAITKLLRLDFSSYSLEDESLAPDGGEFYYPETGIQELPNAFARATENHGGKVFCSTKLLGVDKGKKEVRFETGGTSRTVSYGTLISTIPLHAFYHLCGGRDPSTEAALARLKYMDIVFVYLFLERDRVSNDHWLYFPDKDIVFNRAVEFKNWSVHMCPQGMTSVCFDITSFPGDEIANSTPEALVKRVTEDAVRAGYIHASDVHSHFVLRLPNAYPVYDLSYRENLATVVRHLESGDTCLLGRTGIFRYNNSDNSIEMAFELADRFTRADPVRSVFDYSIQNTSY